MCGIAMQPRDVGRREHKFLGYKFLIDSRPAQVDGQAGRTVKVLQSMKCSMSAALQTLDPKLRHISTLGAIEETLSVKCASLVF